MDTALFTATPTVTVQDNRRLAVRAVAYCRHPDTHDVTDRRITHHRYDARGRLAQSADPRLSAAKRANFTYVASPAGTLLLTQGADNGTVLTLPDAAGRPLLVIGNLRATVTAAGDAAQAVTRTWQYEEHALAGRLLSISERVAGASVRVVERFVYAGSTAAEQARNLAGQCVSHFDTAGLVQVDSIGLTGAPRAVTRRLLQGADDPTQVADWQGPSRADWQALLDSETHTTLTTVDATGTPLTTTDAQGHRQRMSYDVMGRLAGSWVTLAGGSERVIVKSLSWSAAGQKLQEKHGNGLVTTFTYEARSQRLIGIKTQRPHGHAAGAKVLQDLRYAYDPVGNVLKVSNDAEETRFWRNQKVVPENIYTYDSLYQLISASGREMANAGQQGTHLPLPTDPTAYTQYTRTYHYDAAGNLTQIRHSAPATNNHYTTDITLSNTNNRGVLSTLAANPEDVDALFTAGGQQTQLQPGQTLIWTPRNELLQVTPVVRDGAQDDCESYRYDAASQRVLKVSQQLASGTLHTQRTLYLPGLEVRTKTQGETTTERLHVVTVGEAGRAQVRLLHWESSKPAEIANDQLRYSYDGPTGSSGLEVDGDGQLMSAEEYYPYGGTAISAARSQVEASYKTLHYSGKERDATGLYYYGYRYYQPWVGRWLSADPAGTLDGLNLFRMVSNNPVRYRDALGQVTEESFNTLLGLVKHFWDDPAPDRKAVSNEYHRRSINAELSVPMSEAEAEQQVTNLEQISNTLGWAVNIYAQGQKALSLREGYENAQANPREQVGYYRIFARKAGTSLPAKARLNVAVRHMHLAAMSRAVATLTVKNPSLVDQAKVTAFDHVGRVAESAVIYLKQHDLAQAQGLKDQLMTLMQDELAGSGATAQEAMIERPSVGMMRLGKGIDYKEFSTMFSEQSQGSIALGLGGLLRDVAAYRQVKPSVKPKDALKHVLKTWGYERRDAALVKRTKGFDKHKEVF